MMHHPNMHHQPMSGHPPQHMPAHQGMPGHHQMHQMHRENRVSMGPSQPGGGMGAHGHHAQPMGGMGAMGPPPHHAPPRQPHPIRAMPHHPPAQHHSVPPQMKPMRRPYLGGGYGPSVMPPPYAQPEPARQEPVLPSHSGFGLRNRPLLSPVLTSSKPPPTTSTTKLTTDFVVAAPLNSAPANKTAAAVPEPAPGALAGAAASAAADEAEGARGGAADSEAGRPSPTHTQANSKEKTPMCLVNELARYNKIKHQYRLTSETGPAHKKVFTVTLRLGDTEEYTAEGSSIKRAQHTAASSALAGTGFPPPPPRALPPHQAAHHHHRHSGAVMPTVELNALAMKLCQPAVYTSVPPVPAPPRPPRARPPPPYRPHPPFLPAPYPRMLGPTLLYRVRVSVGGRAWLGEGATPQAARHDAAARALHDLRPPPSVPPAALAAPAATSDTAGTVASPTSSPGSGDAAELLSAAAGGESKSPVSLVHELALKRNLSVQFGVKSERGPPHMRVFITTCTVGDMETEGEGNGKKVSKRRAAENMLDEMRRRWPPALLRARPPHDKRRQLVAKKKPRNLIKDSMPSAEGASADNPISRLAVARHAARARSPQYRVVEERGVARRREFLVQCDAPPHRATGLGPNKKTAKRRAAHNVLLAMEMNGSPSECPASPAASASPEGGVIGTADNAKTTSNDVKRKDGDSSNASAAGGANADVRQPVPGVLLMDYQKRSGQPQTPNGVSESSAVGSAGAGGSTPGAKDQLMYLSQLLGFSVQFSDFPKRNHGEYLSLVSLSTEPPVMCHGGGPSTAHSHEQCARAALRALKLMGLDAPPQGVASKPGLVANGISE